MKHTDYFKWVFSDIAWDSLGASLMIVTFEDGTKWSKLFLGLYLRYE